jgi:hypothetical protein
MKALIKAREAKEYMKWGKDVRSWFANERGREETHPVWWCRRCGPESDEARLGIMKSSRQVLSIYGAMKLEMRGGFRFDFRVT